MPLGFIDLALAELLIASLEREHLGVLGGGVEAGPAGLAQSCHPVQVSRPIHKRT